MIGTSNSSSAELSRSFAFSYTWLMTRSSPMIDLSRGAKRIKGAVAYQTLKSPNDNAMQTALIVASETIATLRE
ncbi:hypothetical protein KCU65_g76, partial [Aureobasidium melanogenum]